MQTKRCLPAALLLGLSLTAAAQNPQGQPPFAVPSSNQAPAERAAPPAPRVAPPLPIDRPIFDVFALIDRLAGEMDKEFIVDPRISREMFGWSTAGDDADYETLLALLRSNQFVAIEVGDQIRIVSEATARTEPSLMLNEDDSRVSDHAVVTRVIDVADIRTTAPDGSTAFAGATLVPVLRPLMSTAIGNVMAVPGSNKIVLTDRYDNMRRITAIIDALRD